MTAITYDEGGLYLITGACIAVDDQFHRAEEDDAFGYYTILSDDAGRYCITLNLPIGNFVPPNWYPAVNDRVMVYAENIERSKDLTGYAEICRVASQNEIKQERELFAKNTDPMPTTVSILRLYNALNETDRHNLIKECIRPDDQAVVSISARVFRAVHESNRHRERQRG